MNLLNRTTLNKRYRKPKERSRMDNPVKLATFGIQDTRRRHMCHHCTQTNTIT